MATINADLSSILSELSNGKAPALPLMNKAKKLLKELGNPAPNGIKKDDLIALLESVIGENTDSLDNDTDNNGNATSDTDTDYPIPTGYASGSGHQLYQVGIDSYQALDSNGKAIGEVIPWVLYSQMSSLGMLSKWQAVKAPKVIVIESKKDWGKIPVEYFTNDKGDLATCTLGQLGGEDSPAWASDINDKDVSYSHLYGKDLIAKLVKNAYANDQITLAQYADLLNIKPIKGKANGSQSAQGCLTADQKYKRYRAALIKAKLECPDFQPLLDKMADKGITMAELKQWQGQYDIKKTHINSVTSHLNAMPMGYRKDGDVLTLTTSQIPMD